MTDTEKYILRLKKDIADEDYAKSLLPSALDWVLDLHKADQQKAISDTKKACKGEIQKLKGTRVYPDTVQAVVEDQIDKAEII